MARLEGKIALVTGASRGIGRATAKLFAAEGAKVGVLSRTLANVEAVVAEIKAAGGTALAVPADLGNADDINAVVKKVVDAYGGLDILVNNAFDPTVAYASVLDLPVEQFQRNLDIGPIAYLRAMQAAYPHLKVSGDGRVINFGSLAGVSGLAGMAPYNMAKEAVRALTRTAAREWGGTRSPSTMSCRWLRLGTRSRCPAADQSTRPLRIAGGRHRARGAVPGEQGRPVPDRLLAHARWWVDHRQCPLSYPSGPRK